MQQKFYHLTSKSFEDIGVVTYKELWDKVKGEYKGLSCEFPVTFEKKEDTGEMTMVFSTADEDRHGDTVVQDWDLKWYKKNPVLLDSHNYDSIGHIIGKVKKIRVEDNRLKGEIEFAEMNPKGALAKAMAEAGFINTSSVGFIPKEFSDDGKILKSELLENSLVSVPANARALFEKTIGDAKQEIAEMEKEIAQVNDATEASNEGEIAEQEMTDNSVSPETVIETKIKIDKRRLVLNAIAQALREMERTNLEQKKRYIFKALRSL